MALQLWGMLTCCHSVLFLLKFHCFSSVCCQALRWPHTLCAANISVARQKVLSIEVLMTLVFSLLLFMVIKICSKVNYYGHNRNVKSWKTRSVIEFAVLESVENSSILHCAKKHMAYRKKYKPCILKYKALISKYMPCIFRLYNSLINNVFWKIFEIA